MLLFKIYDLVFLFFKTKIIVISDFEYFLLNKLTV